MATTCSATTASGKRCSNAAADSSGLCRTHLAKKRRDERKGKYDEVVDAILSVCERKGWNAYLDNEDQELQFIEIVFSKGFGINEVSGIIYATVDENLRYRIESTSFHNYGQKDLFEAIGLKFKELGWDKKNKNPQEDSQATDVHHIISRLLNNFDRVARQLKRRYASRPPFEIGDEYDAQDLLHAMLRGYFNDVRPEEYTPSKAGSASRVDFLLKVERSVIELKFATPKLREKEIGEQLIIDIKKYQSHPECKSLYCLIYDPTGVVRNPAGLSSDLTGKHDELTVYVSVVPN